MEHTIARSTGLALLSAFVLTLIATLPQPLAAQYFGRNQVQYREFDFRVLETENFDIYFYPEEEEAAREVGRMSERWYARFSRLFDHEFEDRQPVIMYATHPHFQQTSILGGGVGETTGGATEAFKQRVVMPFSYSFEETDHVLGHELVHAFQYDISGLGRAGGGIEAAARRFQVPLWFIEGMAEYLSVGPVDPHTAMWLRDGALRGDIPSIERMTNDPRVFPYRWGQALWAYVGGVWGDAAIGQILKLAGQGVPYPVAFERILNITLEELSGDWHAAIRRAYLPLLAERPEAREVARPLITGERRGGRMNLAPVLSPDGQWVVFLSELDFLDVELHLADATTGEVVRTLQRGTALDPHFGSLRYISSAGTWSPDGSRFALSALRGGGDVIVILDVERGRRLSEIRIPGIDEISNPSWSPDGRTIAFSGLLGGISNLYTVDIESEEVTQLTDDAHTVLHPAYSPDGSRIAFVTDPDTDLDELTYGPYSLVVMDVATRSVKPVPGAGGQKNINPQWTGDGSGIYFISDRTGIPNIYLVDLESGKLALITDLFTGVSGITDMSPAMTMSHEGNRLLFTEYAENGYNIYALTEADELAGTPLEPADTNGGDELKATAALLPPVPRPEEGAFNRVTEMLADASTGLPTPQEAMAFEEVPYRPRLGLDYLGQPQVGVSIGGGAFGSGGVNGGIFGIFSDILARHQLFAAVQAQGQFDEIGFALQYVNRNERWNFGGAAQRVPVVYGSYSVFAEEDFLVESLARIRLFDTSLQGFAQYPFSSVRRAEFSAGLRRISRDVQFFEFLFDRQTELFVGEREREIDDISLNLFETSAALVYDNALVGYTSPFAGQRYRFQISPTFGEIQFIQALADYRRYLYARPFTLAIRGLHVGRYGPDAEDEDVFTDPYLGQPWYVRGYYDVYNQCNNNRGSQDCDLLNNLFGSRIAVANAELRFPLVGQLVVGNSLGFPPIEGFLFADAGIAWSKNINPVFERGMPLGDDGLVDPDKRGFITSAGVGARVNLFGVMVLEIDYARPFEREDQNWVWQFNFLPGF